MLTKTWRGRGLGLIEVKAGKINSLEGAWPRQFFYPLRQQKRKFTILKFKLVMGRKYPIICANAQHAAWKSSSTIFVNLHAKIGRRNVFFKAFKQKTQRKLRDKFCTDCLKTCWTKRSFTTLLPKNYERLPAFSVVGNILRAWSLFVKSGAVTIFIACKQNTLSLHKLWVLPLTGKSRLTQENLYILAF